MTKSPESNSFLDASFDVTDPWTLIILFFMGLILAVLISAVAYSVLFGHKFKCCVTDDVDVVR